MKANSKLVEMKSLSGALKSMLCFCERRKKKKKKNHDISLANAAARITSQSSAFSSALPHPPTLTEALSSLARLSHFFVMQTRFLCGMVLTWGGGLFEIALICAFYHLLRLTSGPFFFFIPRLQTRRLLHVVLSVNIIENNDNKKEHRIE